MRQPHFYSNMPPQQPFHNFPNQMHHYGYQAPRPYPGAMIPPGYPGPNSTPRLDSFMEAANKFISTYQSFQPLIAQATPMLRNLPALWKLYKGFQSIPNQGDQKHRPFNKRDDRTFQRHDFLESRPYQREDRYESKRKQNHEYYRSENKTGTSLPRIYQPPFHY